MTYKAQNEEILPGQEITVTGRVLVEAAQFQGLVEAQIEKVLMEAMLNQLE